MNKLEFSNIHSENDFFVNTKKMDCLTFNIGSKYKNEYFCGSVSFAIENLKIINIKYFDVTEKNICDCINDMFENAIIVENEGSYFCVTMKINNIYNIDYLVLEKDVVEKTLDKKDVDKKQILKLFGLGYLFSYVLDK